ncbi:PASTA domain-containing protein [candidate division KSB1 bacterium]
MIDLTYEKYISILKISTIVFSLCIVLFLIADKIIMPIYVKHGDEINMPDLFEKKDTQALSELRMLGFEMEIEKKHHPNIKPGLVTYQSPLPFTKVKKGRKVKLSVSLGEKKIKMPDLMNISPREAELILKKSNLKLGEVVYEYNSEFTKGVVFNQMYERGWELKKETVIDIVVSNGPEPNVVTMPNLLRKSLKYAREAIQKNGLILGNIVYQEEKEILPNTVLFQDPPYLRLIEPGTVVTLIVSKE